MMTIKNRLTCVIAFFAVTLLGFSQEELPRDARKLIDELELAEFKETISLEKKFVKEKEEMIEKIRKAADRLKGADALSIKALAKLQIEIYRREIKASNVIIASEKALSIVEFNTPYTYVHPLSDYKNQRCTMTFYYDGTLYLLHEDDERGDFKKEWKWYVNEKGQIYVQGDALHGPMYITKNGARDISIQWTGKINKTSRARLKR